MTIYPAAILCWAHWQEEPNGYPIAEPVLGWSDEGEPMTWNEDDNRLVPAATRIPGFQGIWPDACLGSLNPKSDFLWAVREAKGENAAPQAVAA